MSLFRKPKKIQRRVFSSTLDEEEETSSGVGCGTSLKDGRKLNECGMEIDDNGDMVAPPAPQISAKVDKKKSKEGKLKSSSTNKKEIGAGDLGKSKALLSFADEGRSFREKYKFNKKNIVKICDFR